MSRTSLAERGEVGGGGNRVGPGWMGIKWEDGVAGVCGSWLAERELQMAAGGGVAAENGQCEHGGGAVDGWLWRGGGGGSDGRGIM